jgi:hypothetical protein
VNWRTLFCYRKSKNQAGNSLELSWQFPATGENSGDGQNGYQK